jgi:hypothetical protein
MSFDSVASTSSETATHKCGRCRHEFAVDAEPEHRTDAHWWLCPPCREKPLGNKASMDARWA